MTLTIKVFSSMDCCCLGDYKIKMLNGLRQQD